MDQRRRVAHSRPRRTLLALALASLAAGAAAPAAADGWHTQDLVAAVRAAEAARDDPAPGAAAERPPAAPNTWYTRGAVAALRAADATHDLRATGVAALNSGLATAVSEFPKLGPRWLRRSVIDLRLSRELQPAYGVRTVQPLYRSRFGRHTLLVEGRFARDGNGERTTGAAGLGYQRLLHRNRLLLGAGVFSDHEWALTDRHRLGAGIVIRSRPMRFDIIHHRTMLPDIVPDASGLDDALKAYRFTLDLQLPYLPWARAYGEWFQEETNVHGDITGGERFGLRLNPLPPLQVEFGGTGAHGADPVYVARVRYRKVLGRPPAKRRPLIDHEALAFDDVSARSLDPFWR